MKLEALKKSFMKLNTSSVSDALDSLGFKERVTGLVSRTLKKKMLGFAYTVQYDLVKASDSFENAGNYIDSVPKDAIVVIDNAGRDWCTTWGGILTEFSRIKNIGGAVVHGAVRDFDELQESQLPIFSSAIFMASGKNRVRKVAEQTTITIGHVHIVPGDLVFADNNGVLFIPQAQVDEVLARAERIESTERNIIEAIRAGMPLLDARKKFNYAKPWCKVS